MGKILAFYTCCLFLLHYIHFYLLFSSLGAGGGGNREKSQTFPPVASSSSSTVQSCNRPLQQGQKFFDTELRKNKQTEKPTTEAPLIAVPMECWVEWVNTSAHESNQGHKLQWHNFFIENFIINFSILEIYKLWHKMKFISILFEEYISKIISLYFLEFRNSFQ